MSVSPNYSNNNDIPFKKGKIKDIVTPTRPKVYRIRRTSTKEVANDLYTDLVQVFANHGITLSNVYSLAAELVKRGWTRQICISWDDKKKDR